MIEYREIRHFHLFCGLGGGAKGFNRGKARVGNLVAKFRCIGGIDVDPVAIRDFEKLSGVRGTVLDLFTREQYIAFHGKEPPAIWREATPADIVRAAGGERPDIGFLSAPCKGNSGLLSQEKSKTAKYVALNELSLRGVWLMLEAWKDDPVPLYVFENVPRIAHRSRHLLDQINALFRHYGYAVAETTHDCGEIGNLAQSRKRFLLVARHIEKVPPFLYEPEKHRLRAVGDILGRMPLPGDPAGGPMHRIPRLQWKTWVRLAFVKAGSDWRSLNDLAVEDGYLKDFLIIPAGFHNGYMGVNGWGETAGTVRGRSLPLNGKFSVADPRTAVFKAGYGVNDWEEPIGAVAGESLPSNGRFSVSDPRFPAGGEYGQLGVRAWDQSTGTVTGQRSPIQGGFSVADPRLTLKHNNCFRIVRFDQAAGTVTGGTGPSAGGQGVADPRPPAGPLFSKYKVTDWGQNAGTVIGGDDQGAYAVADPRASGSFHGKGKYKITGFNDPANTVIGGSTTGQGAFAVADPRPNMNREKGDAYLTGGHYGVVQWESPSGAVSAAAGYDNGRWSVADPRLPAPDFKMVAFIQSLDGTWHRPFTTLDLAALQSLVQPEEIWSADPQVQREIEICDAENFAAAVGVFRLAGESDQAWRERIGNAVPPDAAEAIASVMGTTLLLAATGETFVLSSTPIWVRPVAIALAVRGAAE